jgi:hypothetical protein
LVWRPVTGSSNGNHRSSSSSSWSVLALLHPLLRALLLQCLLLSLPLFFLQEPQLLLLKQPLLLHEPVGRC